MDIVIAVVGVTGAGKTSLIGNLTQDASIKAGHGLDSGQWQQTLQLQSGE
jgi:adenylate kinase